MAIIREACVETIDRALLAEKNGADRIEYCANLDQDGLTPAISEIGILLTKIQIPIKVMIRSRSGNFVYSGAEVETMKNRISEFEAIGIDQFVIGALTEDNQIDIEKMKILCDSESHFTFHKAIDLLEKPLKELERLAEIKQVESILTSGQAGTAEAGIDNLNRMIDQFGRRFTFIAAGKITSSNLDDLSKRIKTNEFHGRAIV